MTGIEAALFVVPSVTIAAIIAQGAMAVGALRRVERDSENMRLAVAALTHELSKMNTALSTIEARYESHSSRIARLEDSRWAGTPR